MVNSIHIKLGSLLLGSLVLLSSCIKEQSAQATRAVDDGNGVPLTVTLEATGEDGDTTALDYELYIFRSIAGDGQYVYSQKIAAVEKGMTLKLPLDELATGDYRFLFTALLSEGRDITVTEATGTGFGLETTWEDVRLTATADSLSLHSYYGVTNMSGADIIATGTISGQLGRIVGQPVFDFFKVSDDTDLDSAVAIDAAVATTVLDRIYNVNVTYSGVTTGVSISADGTLVPSATRSTNIEYDIIPEIDIDGGTLKVAVAEAVPAIITLQTTGNIRIMGYPMLPSSEGVKATMTFNYYDTTPACSVPPASIADGHTHSADCYVQKELTVVMPKNTSVEGFSVKSNTYTVTRAGLRCNRIIDVPVSGSLTINTDWDFPASGNVNP